MSNEQRIKLKNRFFELKAKLSPYPRSEYHYKQRVHSLRMGYKAALYTVKFKLTKSEIAERLQVQQHRVYEILRPFKVQNLY